MKIQRYKKAHKHLDFYVNNYRFFQPYQLLVDGTFSFAALQNKFNIIEQMPKYLQGQIKFLTTACVIVETEKLGPKLFGAMLIIKQFAVHKCGHEKNPVTGSKCIRSMIGSDNSSRYIVATQDRLLQEQLRKVPGVPLLYLHGKAPTLEPPSQKSKEFAEKRLQKLTISDQQEEIIKELKKKSGIQMEIDTKPKKKHKKGGPNPLSCKKKKKKPVNDINKKNDKVKEGGKVHKRKRIKLPAHIKDALKNTA